MGRLEAILKKYCVAAPGESTVDKLLGASFAAVTPSGITTSAAGLLSPLSSSPFLPTSVTWLASVTKLLTTTAVLHLLAHPPANSPVPSLSLDTDLRPIVPELGVLEILCGFKDDGTPILEKNTAPITLRHLLTHTAGFGIDIADPDLARWAKATGRKASSMDWTLEGIVMPLKFAPGEGWYYGSSTEWAGVVLERVAGVRLEEYMQENIFHPLGMEGSTFRPERYEGGGMPAWTWRQEDRSLNVARPNIAGPDHELDSAGGGLFSSAHDYAILLQALLTDGKIPIDTSLLSKPQLNDPQRAMLTAIADAYRYMFAPELPAGMPMDYGLGGLVSLEDVPGKRRGGAVMWSGNCNGRWWMDRESGVAGVLVVNVQPHGDAVVNRLWDELERAVYEGSK